MGRKPDGHGGSGGSFGFYGSSESDTLGGSFWRQISDGQKIISNESVDLNNPKEFNDPQVFDDPKGISMEWKYGLW